MVRLYKIRWHRWRLGDKLTHIASNKFLKILKKFTQVDEAYSFQLNTIFEMDALVLSRKCTR
jgi:hypothetical protein